VEEAKVVCRQRGRAGKKRRRHKVKIRIRRGAGGGSIRGAGGEADSQQKYYQVFVSTSYFLGVETLKMSCADTEQDGEIGEPISRPGQSKN
jgi:hypothetical protein